MPSSSGVSEGVAEGVTVALRTSVCVAVGLDEKPGVTVLVAVQSQATSLILISSHKPASRDVMPTAPELNVESVPSTIFVPLTYSESWFPTAQASTSMTWP